MKVMSNESENVQDGMHAHVRTCNIELEDMKWAEVHISIEKPEVGGV